jgi:hypothetical protein
LAAVTLSFLASIALPARPALDRTLFKDLAANDPVREVVQTVLGSRFFSMREAFPGREWTASGYGAAWDRARQYFPAKAYYVVPGTYFMTHGFDADGRLFMEIHESDFLKLCVENRRTFARDSVAGAYGRMLAATDGREAAAFGEKMGRLEPFFREAAALRGLEKTLGESSYPGFLKSLREEDYHMLAGGLMHEGMHAGLDDAIVSRLQADFSAGTKPVQWDELRAFMAEAGYHGAYGRWAGSDLAGHWRTIEGLLGELEGLRKKANLRPGTDENRFGRVRARAWAHAALLRLRTREIWQSARRMQDLAGSFREDYLRGAAPSDVESALAGLERDTSAYAAAAGEALQETELAVRSLEALLDTWGSWADGRRPFPPPVTDLQALVKRVEEIRWPDPAPASAGAAVLMKRAAEALSKERTSS